MDGMGPSLVCMGSHNSRWQGIRIICAFVGRHLFAVARLYSRLKKVEWAWGRKSKTQPEALGGQPSFGSRQCHHLVSPSRETQSTCTGRLNTEHPVWREYTWFSYNTRLKKQRKQKSSGSVVGDRWWYSLTVLDWHVHPARHNYTYQGFYFSPSSAWTAIKTIYRRIGSSWWGLHPRCII